MRVLAGVLLSSSLMGKSEIKITVTHPEIFRHTVTCTTSCLGKVFEILDYRETSLSRKHCQFLLMLNKKCLDGIILKNLSFF